MTSEVRMLPHFRVRTVETQANGDAVARGELQGWTREGTLGWFWLWLSEDKATTAIVEAEDAELTVRVVAQDLRDVVISAGDAYPWLHSYWQAYHVTMIGRGQWEAREFVPADATYFELNGVYGWSRADAGVPDGARVTGRKKGGWDHEHCEICNARIGRGGGTQGFVDPEDHWLCPGCYERWAKPGDLGFLDQAGVVSQARLIILELVSDDSYGLWEVLETLREALPTGVPVEATAETEVAAMLDDGLVELTWRASVRLPEETLARDEAKRRLVVRRYWECPPPGDDGDEVRAVASDRGIELYHERWRRRSV